MAVRVVDAAGAEVADGETGEIVVSCLYNPATVLLNYRLGDLGAVTREQCRCGRNFARILAFEGRKSEVIELADGRTVPVAAFLGRFDEDVQGALKVRVLAGGMGRVRWQLMAGAATDRQRIRSRIVDKCRVVFGELLQAEVEFVDDLPMQASGKFPLVITSGGDADDGAGAPR